MRNAEGFTGDGPNRANTQCEPGAFFTSSTQCSASGGKKKRLLSEPWLGYTRPPLPSRAFDDSGGSHPAPKNFQKSRGNYMTAKVGERSMTAYGAKIRSPNPLTTFHTSPNIFSGVKSSRQKVTNTFMLVINLLCEGLTLLLVILGGGSWGRGDLESQLPLQNFSVIPLEGISVHSTVVSISASQSRILHANTSFGGTDLVRGSVTWRWGPGHFVPNPRGGVPASSGGGKSGWLAAAGWQRLAVPPAHRSRVDSQRWMGGRWRWDKEVRGLAKKKWEPRGEQATMACLPLKR